MAKQWSLLCSLSFDFLLLSCGYRRVFQRQQEGNLFQRLGKGDGPKKKWAEKKRGCKYRDRGGRNPPLSLLLFLHFSLLFSSALFTSHHSPLTEILGKASPVSNAAIHKWFNGLIQQQNGNVSWRRRAQIKQLAWPMVEQQIEHRKSCLVLSAPFPVVNWRSRPVDKPAYCFATQRT